MMFTSLCLTSPPPGGEHPEEMIASCKMMPRMGRMSTEISFSLCFYITVSNRALYPPGLLRKAV